MSDGNYLMNNRGLDLEIEIDGYKYEHVILPKWAEVNIYIYYIYINIYKYIYIYHNLDDRHRYHR